MAKSQTKQGNAQSRFQYLRLADAMEEEIKKGVYRTGEKLPAIRTLHAQAGVSITTVCQAYGELENRGLVEPRPKSGYYVKPRLHNILPLPTVRPHRARPEKVQVNVLAETMQETISNQSMLPLGTAVPSPDLLPLKQLASSARTVAARYLKNNNIGYGSPGGLPALRRQIAKRMVGCGVQCNEEDIIITNGCMEAITLCLRAIAKPGDTVLVESPTFVCYLQLIEDLNMMALEIPTDPEQGIDLAALSEALAEHEAHACILNPNFQNPLGFEMPTANKKKLLNILAERNIPIIEDDIYGELYFGSTRPPLMKSFDAKGLVLYCSSFSKDLAPDLRVGWTIPGQFTNRVQRLKFNSTISSSKLNQMVMEDFLANGHFDRHLRRMRSAIQNRLVTIARMIGEYFPAGTKITAPQGGYILWVQLDDKVDGFELFHRAKQENISILPGEICSSTSGYKNCIRISCCHPWSAELEEGIKKLAELITDLAEKE
ncbi:MAG: PLP-dependent aminotransferase family protein [Desulfobulbaceae bacterium]|nr:PLP-dependent aminotransferase family protein [Desulfobulbaceae bacterium]